MAVEDDEPHFPCEKCGDDPKDVCCCGDYRHQHVDGKGRCKLGSLCTPYPCGKFRLFLRAERPPLMASEHQEPLSNSDAVKARIKELRKVITSRRGLIERRNTAMLFGARDIEIAGAEIRQAQRQIEALGGKVAR